MSDEPKPEEEVQEVEQETPAEAKPGKKAKVAKKKAAELQTEEAQVDTTLTTETADRAPAQAGDDMFAQGVQALLRAEYDAADNFFGQALTNSRKNGDQAGQVAALEQLGHLCYLRGAIPQARDYYQQASSMRGAS